MPEVRIRGDTIRLGQLLKLAGLADSGAEAKALLAGGAVSVDGQPEERRGRQLHPGDTVRVGGQELHVRGEHEQVRGVDEAEPPGRGTP